MAAIKAAQYGGKVLLVEKEALGGVCLNKGCIPTKTLLKSSGFYKSIKHADKLGVAVDHVSFDFKKMRQRKNDVVKTLVNGIKGLLKTNGVEVVSGVGTVVDSSTVKVGETVYKSQNIIIATGSRPFMPPIKGIDSPFVMDSDAFLAMESFPSSVVIIGGGVIGTEFAILLGELGCKVTIIEMMDEVLFMADHDIIREAGKILKINNVAVITSAKVTEISDHQVIYEKAGVSGSVEGEKILVAVGRVPNTDQNELSRLGIKHDRGKITTDEKMQTNIPGIYAIGDVNGKYMLAHVASEEGIIAVENIFGHKAKMSYKSIPQCIYSHPEMAWVGLTEKEASEKGYAFEVGKFPIAANGKSLAEAETSGFIKVIADKKYHEILGVHMVCSHATDMIGEAVLAISLEATADDVASAIHPHPTVSEALMEAALAAMGKAIHVAK